MALTDRGVKGLRARAHAYRISDKGDVRGLNLQVTPSGQKSWMLRYSDEQGKERFYSFGQYPRISLAEAREEALALKAKVKPRATWNAGQSQRRRSSRPLSRSCSTATWTT